MIVQEIIFLILLSFLLNSESFLNNFKLIKSPSSSKLLLHPGDNDFIEENIIKKELFIDGLKLWNQYFASLDEWKRVKPSDQAFDIATLINFSTVKDMIERFKNDTSLVSKYPMIPDLIVEKAASDYILIEDSDIELVVEFFTKNKFYRQLASLIALNEPPVTSNHFKNPSLNDLIYTLEYLFKLKPEKIYDFFGKVGNDKLFLVAPLIACSDLDLDVVRKIITKFLKVKGVSITHLIGQICSGIMLTDFKAETEYHIFQRNEVLIDFLKKVIKTPSLYVSTIIRACHVTNLMKLNSTDTQKIMLEIYLDESVESTDLLFDVLLKIVKTDFHKKMIESFRYGSA